MFTSISGRPSVQIESLSLPLLHAREIAGERQVLAREGRPSEIGPRQAGTYVSVEPFHLFRYLDEQSFRYNNRKDMNDADRFSAAIYGIVGKRLPYDSLI